MNNFNQPGANGSGPWGAPTPPRHILNYTCRRPIRGNSNIVACGLFLVSILSYFVGTAIQRLFAVFLPTELLVDFHPLLLQIRYLITYVLAFAVPCAVMVAWIRIPTHVAFPMKRFKADIAIPAVLLCLGLNIVGGYCSAILSMLLETGFGLVPTAPDYPSPTSVSTVIIYVLSLAVAPAILEEMVFRGVIMQSLRRFGDGFALVASAIIFSLCHGNLIQGPPTLLIGLVIGYFVLRTGSLGIGILIHFCNNMLSIVWELCFVSLSAAAYEALMTLVYGLYLLGGAAALAYLLIKFPKMFRTAPSNFPLSEPRKHLYFYTAPVMLLYLVMTAFTVALYFE